MNAVGRRVAWIAIAAAVGYAVRSAMRHAGHHGIASVVVAGCAAGFVWWLLERRRT